MVVSGFKPYHHWYIDHMVKIGPICFDLQAKFDFCVPSIFFEQYFMVRQHLHLGLHVSHSLKREKKTKVREKNNNYQ
jgi:hypothetical protein